jgi:hypothetical protein
MKRVALYPHQQGFSLIGVRIRRYAHTAPLEGSYPTNRGKVIEFAVTMVSRIIFWLRANLHCPFIVDIQDPHVEHIFAVERRRLNRAPW